MNKQMRWSVLFATFLFLISTFPSGWAEEKGGPPAGFGQGEKKGWEGDTPPGWEQGEKKGWGEEGMPPGLAKKAGGEGKKGKGRGKGKKK